MIRPCSLCILHDGLHHSFLQIDPRSNECLLLALALHGMPLPPDQTIFGTPIVFNPCCGSINRSLLSSSLIAEQVSLPFSRSPMAVTRALLARSTCQCLDDSSPPYNFYTLVFRTPKLFGLPNYCCLCQVDDPHYKKVHTLQNEPHLRPKLHHPPPHLPPPTVIPIYVMSSSIP